MHNFDYTRSSETAELIIRDCSGMKIDSFRWSLQDKQLEKKIFNIVKVKYGVFKPTISDLDWMNK